LFILRLESVADKDREKEGVAFGLTGVSGKKNIACELSF
jgi:hypothetical protein